MTFMLRIVWEMFPVLQKYLNNTVNKSYKIFQYKFQSFLLILSLASESSLKASFRSNNSLKHFFWSCLNLHFCFGLKISIMFPYTLIQMLFTFGSLSFEEYACLCIYNNQHCGTATLLSEQLKKVPLSIEENISVQVIPWGHKTDIQTNVHSSFQTESAQSADSERTIPGDLVVPDPYG